MKPFFLIPVITCLIVCSLPAQEKNLEFNRLNTRKLTLKGHTPSEIYSVLLPESERTLNPKYAKLKCELDSLLIDSTFKSVAYSKAIDKFNDIEIIKSKISTFITSSESFGNKLILLKEAQILALKQHIDVLLYSDDYINKKMEAGFLILKLNPENMKLHLTNVLSRLKSNSYPEPPIYPEVAVLRSKLSHTDKMIAVEKPNDKMGYVLQNSVAPENITGEFLEIGRYFVLNVSTNGFSKGQLITQRTILNYRISKEKLNFNVIKVLIENRHTKEMYLVDNAFLEGFSVKS
ncbi:hypothetical protein [Mariniflexile sp.]|uniref:hypothetical protein n=1 Tax=Mariniflexile sp. TaxID=1979402 RepID=UPI00356874C6